MSTTPATARFSMFKKTVPLVAAAGLFALLAACGKSGSDTATSPSPKLEGPKETVALYRSNCISCHGAELEGKMGDSTNLQHVGGKLTQEQIRRQIAEGRDLMPAFKDRLTAEQIDALASWLAERR
ncbi:MAG: cytochrome C551 [Cohnella sp.]|uniref:c-type cytochrome n=1 Tax=Cohnella sp. TaxID=1883426 RepID=UPI000E395660|nr:cytochrome c [Cohnella sp.]REK64326.1 MAG: cytochrome C551 [Cohnella sp.]